MLRTAVILRAALASAPLLSHDGPAVGLDTIFSAMEASMEAKMSAEKAAMEAKIAELEKRLSSVDATLLESGKARKLYNSAFLAEEPGDDDLTGTMSFIPEITTAMGTTWTIICGALVFFTKVWMTICSAPKMMCSVGEIFSSNMRVPYNSNV